MNDKDYLQAIFDLADLVEDTGGRAEVALVSPQIWAALGGDKLIGSMITVERPNGKPSIQVKISYFMTPTQIHVGAYERLP